MANPSLRDYKGQIGGGFQYANRYQVFIPNMPPSITFFTSNVQTPALNKTHTSAYYQSAELKMDGGTTRWQPWNITMYANINNSNGLEALAEFFRWANQQQGLSSNIGTNRPQDYWREVRFTPLLNDGTTETGEFILRDAFVTEIPPADMSWEAEDLLKFNVVLNFSEVDFITGGEVIFGHNEGA